MERLGIREVMKLSSKLGEERREGKKERGGNSEDFDALWSSSLVGSVNLL
jgi:hypothetical protein